jgi:hypothetical protein
MSNNERSGKPVGRLEKAKAIINKHVVIGLTYYDHEGTFLEQKQMHGKVISVDKNCIMVELDGLRAGETFCLPRDLRAFRKASPGIYRLKSTGEEVVNPDYTTAWNITKPPPGWKPEI